MWRGAKERRYRLVCGGNSNTRWKAMECSWVYKVKAPTKHHSFYISDWNSEKKALSESLQPLVERNSNLWAGYHYFQAISMFIIFILQVFSEGSCFLFMKTLLRGKLKFSSNVLYCSYIMSLSIVKRNFVPIFKKRQSAVSDDILRELVLICQSQV